MLGRRRFLEGAAGVGAAGVLGFEAIGCGSKPSNDWPIGAYFSLTGGDAKFGTDSKEGIEIAVEEINAAGGVKGKPLRVIFADDKSLPNEVTNQVQGLIDRDKVVALLGEVASSRSIPGGIIANKKGIPMISPSSTNAEVTKGRDFVFRVCFVDEFQGRMGADFCINKLGKKNIGLFYAEDDVYSQGLATEFSKAVADLGGKIVVEKKFTQAEMNFTTFAKDIKPSGAEMIYAPIYYKQMVQLGRHAKDQGVTGDMWLGSDGWSGEQALLDELEGAYFTDHHAPDLPWGPSKKFVAAYEAKHKRKPSSLAAMGYDSALVLADAIKRAKEDTPKGIRDAIAETKDFPGASGIITIDGDHNAQKPIVVVQIRSKEAHYAAVVGPGAGKLLEGATPPALTASASATATASAVETAPPVESAAPDASASAPSASAPASGSAPPDAGSAAASGKALGSGKAPGTPAPPAAASAR
jgi:branched-chain amino acid transport system substrate-binding protein